MFEAVILLVIIALVLLFLRAGRQNTIAYRKRVAPPNRGNAIDDHPTAFGHSGSSDQFYTNSPGSENTLYEPLAFGGAEFGGGGAGESYDTGTFGGESYDTGTFGGESYDTGAYGSDPSDAGDAGNAFSYDDSGSSCDSDGSGSDSSSDSSGDSCSSSND
ncbi:hypothetical protein [Dyadobacter fermentans]|uniref:Uncharacterized protein n=1 Tax=Dyadobacter fermentans (strain ATCC 700827 / DSM 18053 / CIP 107007 / KCTC 52180 / NS114) TaxID=471854 RepID=C6VRQ3_DYAFD|nr:hypothetical protein [Dyadobacter fermentans]ACT92756.1 hypothetical protein Dfer_1511 [Dyadobacter fermentans DSM 18053]